MSRFFNPGVDGAPATVVKHPLTKMLVLPIPPLFAQPGNTWVPHEPGNCYLPVIGHGLVVIRRGEWWDGHPGMSDAQVKAAAPQLLTRDEWETQQAERGPAEEALPVNPKPNAPEASAKPPKGGGGK